jgi:tetratricopeptide (TPR) repeat protein
MESLDAAEKLDPTNSDTTYHRALCWAAQGDYGKAQVEFAKAIRLAPTDENLYAARAMCWRSQGDVTKAVNDLDTALRIRPDMAGFLELRAKMLLDQPDPTGNNVREAIASAHRACELTHWEDASQIKLLAQAYDQASDKAGIRECREKLEELNRPNTANLPPLPTAPTTPAATAVPEGPLPVLPAGADRNNPAVGSGATPKTASVGWYTIRDGKTVRGGTLNNTVAYVAGASANFYLIRWHGQEVWVKRDDVALGEDCLSYFLEQAGRNPWDGYLQRVCALGMVGAGWIDSAVPFSEAAIRLAPQDSGAHKVRATVEAKKGNLDAARDEFAVAERLDPSDPMTYALRAGIVWRPLKEYAKAEADFDTALRLAPGDETLYLMRSSYWSYRYDFTRALADIDTAIRLWPGYLRAHVRRAEFCLWCPDQTMRNPKEAVVSARKACELTRWKDAAHIHRLAKACELAGYNDDAKRWQDKAEQMEKGNVAQLPSLPK